MQKLFTLSSSLHLSLLCGGLPDSWIPQSGEEFMFKEMGKNPVHPFQFSSVSFFFLFFCLLRNPNKQKFNMENSVSMAIYLNILGCKWQQFNCFMSSWGWQLEGWRTNPNPSKSLVSPQSWFKNCLWSVLKALQVLGPCRSWWWLRQW